MPRLPLQLPLHLVGLLLAGVLAAPLTAQQPPAPAQPRVAAAQPAPAQQAARSPFEVTPAEQTWLDQVLGKWEADSRVVRNFYCEFARDVHNQFGPADGNPFSKEKGKLGYTKPDKGSFEITESLVWTPTPQAAPAAADATQPPPAAGEYKPRLDSDGGESPGEHWVCDGQNVYQYRPNEKQLVVTPIPPQMQGKEIVNGPLPFLFGAEAKKLQERYWFSPAQELCNDQFLGIHAKPKFQEDAANYTDIWVVLRNVQDKPLMPAGLRVRHPDGSWDEYRFDLDRSRTNGALAQLLEPLFRAPRTPIGWRRVEESMRQATAPAAQQR